MLLRRPLSRLFALCAFGVLLGGAACSDSGTVPEFGPEEPPSAPAPEAPEEPCLELTPQLLRFDWAGNPLGAEVLTVRTNCAWRLELPEAAEWLRPSVVAGTGSDSIGFRLYIDEQWHEAEGRIVATAADGTTLLTQRFTVQQGTRPAETEPDAPQDPQDPDDAGDPQPDDPSGDLPSGDPSGGGDPETPPVAPAEPKLVAVDPTFVWWEWSDAAAWKTIDLYVADCASPVWEVAIEGADAAHFEVQTPAAGALQVRVRNRGANERDTDRSAVLSIALQGGNRMTVPLTQARRPAAMGE